MVRRSNKLKATCSKSSKSRAAIFFSSETLDRNFRIVSRPNVAISRYLDHNQHQIQTERKRQAYRWSSSWSNAGFFADKIRNRWINNAFHTPSSNSCIKSTTNMGKRSNPRG